LVESVCANLEGNDDVNLARAAMLPQDRPDGRRGIDEVPRTHRLLIAWRPLARWCHWSILVCQLLRAIWSWHTAKRALR